MSLEGEQRIVRTLVDEIYRITTVVVRRDALLDQAAEVLRAFPAKGEESSELWWVNHVQPLLFALENRE